MIYTSTIACPAKRKNKRQKKESQSQYKKRLENEFCENIIKEKLKYKGKDVKMIDQNKRTYSEIFNHICTDHHGTTSSLNIGRMQTAHLVYVILSRCENCSDIVCVSDKNYKDRINILCPKQLYKIVLKFSKKNDLYYFITSYPITENILNKEIKKTT